jgi:hypothetical protein
MEWGVVFVEPACRQAGYDLFDKYDFYDWIFLNL